MSNFRDTLNTVGEVLGTVQHAYDRTKQSVDNVDKVAENFGYNLIQADEHQRKTSRCKVGTVVFCILVIVTTVLVCLFL